MRITTTITLILILFNSYFSSAQFDFQDVEVQRKEFDNGNEGFRDAWDNIKEGNYFFEIATKGDYKRAVEFYLKANKYNPNNAELNYKIGICYLNSVQTSMCIKFFEKAYEIKPGVSPDINFLLGRGYHLNQKFDNAIEQYQTYIKTLPPDKYNLRKPIIDKHIAECTLSKELVNNPTRVIIQNLGSTVNSFYPDYSPFISTDQSVMIYTSRRDDTRGGEMDPADFQYYEDIYITYNVNGQWQFPINIGKPINSKEHDATAGISPDGQILFIYLKSNGGDIYSCELKKNKWSSPKSLPSQINSSAHEESASLSPDGNTIYFVSDRPGGFGEHDIYKCTKTVKGKWGDAENLGNTVNSAHDERGVFIHPDGKTLYFSSKGHRTMGGYDIFVTQLQDDETWSEPENLGFPINTPDDDLFFVLASNGRHAYYASDQAGGYGDEDIYRITFLNPEQLILSNEDNLLASSEAPVSQPMIESKVKIRTVRLTIVKGIISDAITQEPLEAQIEIIDNEKNELLSVINSNGTTGKYLITLPSGKNYGIAVKVEGYLFHSENFNIPQTTSYQEIEKNIELMNVKPGSKIILNNIFFETAKAILQPESYSELDRLLGVMTTFSQIKVEISGHTDNEGIYNSNVTLSKNRAKAVVDYLINKGIPADRLVYEGYADSQPISTNDTPEGRQLNRRVEFKILDLK